MTPILSLTHTFALLKVCIFKSLVQLQALEEVVRFGMWLPRIPLLGGYRRFPVELWHQIWMWRQFSAERIRFSRSVLLPGHGPTGFLDFCASVGAAPPVPGVGAHRRQTDYRVMRCVGINGDDAAGISLGWQPEIWGLCA